MPTDPLEEIRLAARQAALDAGAVAPCPIHDAVLVKADTSADAQIVAARMWDAGKVDGERDAWMEAVRRVVDKAPDECRRCQNIWFD
jgi:hypothetical protein